MTTKTTNKILAKLFWNNNNLFVDYIETLLNFLSDFKKLKMFRIINAAYGNIMKFPDKERVDSKSKHNLFNSQFLSFI
jgi:hypothetical protein